MGFSAGLGLSSNLIGKEVRLSFKMHDIKVDEGRESGSFEGDFLEVVCGVTGRQTGERGELDFRRD